MFACANFELVKDDGSFCKQDRRSILSFGSVRHCEIAPFPVSEEMNLKTCRVIEIRLVDQIPISEWIISLKFVNKKNMTFDVSAEGDILKILQQLMSYNVETARLKLKLSADIRLGFHSGTTNFKYITELHPSMAYGHPDHSRYTNNQAFPSQSSMPQILPGKDGGTVLDQVSNVRIFIEGIDDANLANLNHIHAIETPKHIYNSSGISHPVILCKPNQEDPANVPIQANENILCAQSSVIKKMLEEGKFVEGTSRRIPMTDRTKKEVTSFLDFLYFGDIANARKDVSLAVTLYEMGHYYDVKEMEKTMKLVLLSQPAKSFFAEATLRLFKLANSFGDMDLKQMAVDVLKMSTDEIFQSGLFFQMFQGDPIAMGELIRMYGKF